MVVEPVDGAVTVPIDGAVGVDGMEFSGETVDLGVDLGPTDAPPTQPTFVDVWRLDENAGGDDVWLFYSLRSWFPGVLRDLCRATGSDYPDAPVVVRAAPAHDPDVYRVADAVDAITTRLSDSTAEAYRDVADLVDGLIIGGVHRDVSRYG